MEGGKYRKSSDEAAKRGIDEEQVISDIPIIKC